MENLKRAYLLALVCLYSGKYSYCFFITKKSFGLIHVNLVVALYVLMKKCERRKSAIC